MADAVEDQGALAVALELAPEARRRIHVDEDVILAVGHVEGQAALLDADEILIERIGLERVEGPPEMRVLPAVAAALGVGLAWIERREALHDRAARRADVEGPQAVEQHLGRFRVALQAEVVEEQRRLGLVADREDEPGDGVLHQRPAGPRLLADVEGGRNDQRARARRDDGRVIDPRPVVARLPVADLDGQFQRVLGVGEDVGLEVVVAGPVLRGVHDGVTAVDAQRLLAVGGVLRDHDGAAEGIAILKGGDDLDRRPGGRRLAGLQRRAAGVAAAPGRVVAVAAVGTADRVGAGVGRRRDRLLLGADHGRGVRATSSPTFSRDTSSTQK